VQMRKEVGGEAIRHSANVAIAPPGKSKHPATSTRSEPRFLLPLEEFGPVPILLGLR